MDEIQQHVCVDGHGQFARVCVCGQDAVAAGNLADVAEQTAQRAAAREAAASMAAHAAEAGRQEALREAKELREQCEALEVRVGLRAGGEGDGHGEY